MCTLTAAERMLATGQFYSAGILAAELGISAASASGLLSNIRISKKYRCVVTPLPNRKVKVVAINGKSISKQSLWALVLFKQPLPQGVQA
ncbi:hypothetical protein [Shewanella frigidimarina]|uniref:hypothetical protein n=1 Tax=Shewanella frigidimarina TaxID=56812 RepID=UPI003D793BEC